MLQTMIQQKAKQLEKMYKKMDLLYRKKERMGLSEEESDQLKEIQLEYFLLYDEIKNDTTTLFISFFWTPRAEKALKDIQKLVPWSGGFVIRNEEFHAIQDAEELLTDEQREEIEENLDILHEEVMLGLEKFVETDDGYNYAIELANMITSSQDGDILDAIEYIDSRYREFADMVQVELRELEVEIEEDEE